jgi:ammonia channel protein AmtB|tara:strand:- start:376 stop:1650 length:1275 start_codon:yes stop_codon:yes gene_type:complete
VTAQSSAAAEGWYYLMTAIMIAIHVGFLLYEVGSSRMQNAVASGVKNLLAFAFMIPTFWLFGWYIYLAFPHGLVPMDMEGYGVPFNVSMGPMLSDQLTGVFWAAFTLFACTTASIFSGAVIERIRISSFVFLAVILGSVCWNLGASWGWHYDGWLVTKFGFHDVAAAGVVHMIAGWFAFGVVLNLGPRVGRYNEDGTMNVLEAHDLRFSFIGLMMIIMGFFGFLGACLIWPGLGGLGMQEVTTWTQIYGAPATLSSFVYNTLMGLAGGMIGAFWMSKGNPFWMMSGGLAGIFACASGLDIYYPGLAFVLGFVGGVIIIPANNLLHKIFKIDDPVGAIAVHGVGGTWGVLAMGIFATGVPGASAAIPDASLWGQIVGGLTMFAVGFIPGYGISYIMKAVDWLRVPDHIQKAGLDKTELNLKAVNY